MFIFGFFSAIYLAIAVFALVMTYDEQQKVKMNGTILKALSFLACLFWPVTFLAVLVFARHDAQLNSLT